MNRAIPIIVSQTISSAFVPLIWLFSPFTAMAQDAASSPPSSDYVSRAEYDKLKSEHEAMKNELEALKTAVRQMANGTAPAAPAEAPPGAEAPSEAKAVVSTPVSQAAEIETGPLATHDFSIVGDAEVQFGKISGQHGAFMLADFAPIFLFRGGDKILFEAGFDFILQNNAPGGSGNTTTVNLSFATLDYLINDYVTFAG